MTTLDVAAIAGGVVIAVLIILVAGYFLGFHSGHSRGWNDGYRDRGEH